MNAVVVVVVVAIAVEFCGLFYYLVGIAFAAIPIGSPTKA